MSKKECVFCNSTEITSYKIKNRDYFFCNDCGGISVNPLNFVSEQKQKERYSFHNNTLENVGYRRFLESFINPVLSFINKNKKEEKGNFFDFGSGPQPCLCFLLDELKNTGKIRADTQIYYWDKYFSDKKTIVPCDYVTCLEVVEHFEHPQESFVDLANCAKDDGYIFVGTMILTNDLKKIENFAYWWYKEDCTHVSFYSLESICCCAKKAGLNFIEKLNDRIVVFQKK